MLTVKMPELQDMVRDIVVDLDEPLMVWGQPGIGKSQGIQQVAAEYDATIANNAFVDIRLSQYDSVDLRGAPVPDSTTKTTVWYMASTLPFKGNPAFAKIKGIIFLFLDEINSAQNAVLAPCYQLINDRCVGEHQLMDNVRIICAGNRETDRGVTTRMPTPIANRLIHVELVTDVESVSQHFTSIGMPAVGVAFLNFRKPLLNTFDPSKPDKAFATPRTWEKALNIYASTKAKEMSKRAGMAGAVGKGPAQEFWTFIDVWQKVVPVSKIIKDPMGTPLPDEESFKYATAVNISGSMDKTNCTALHKYLGRMEQTYLILAWHLALKRDRGLLTTPEFVEMARKHKQVFA